MTSLKANFSFPSQDKSITDSVLVWLLRAFAAIAGAVAAIICIFILKESIPAFSAIGFKQFFFDSSWHPTEQLFNLSPMLAATLLTTAASVALAGPLGLISGLFVHFYLPEQLKNIYRRSIEILAGIPSVVYGFWGLMVIVPIINEIEAPGASLLAGVVVLTIMILPTMALSADAAVSSVPKSYILAARALGLNRAGIVLTAVIPAAKGSLVSGVILSTGRAIGETMAVLMVCGNIVQFPNSVFDPIRTLTANIALEMAYATGTHRASLFVSGLFLLVMIIFLVFGAASLNRRVRHAN